MEIGRSIHRVDALDKVTGRARYTDDLRGQGVLVAKILHSTIANGVVTGMDLTEAQKVPGVVKIRPPLERGGRPPGRGRPEAPEPAGAYLWR